ncbi:MAG: tetratricopeptide repeat protein [Pyrinomonadaceae bacterium]
MTKLPLVLLAPVWLMLACLVAYAQTPCGERDLKCRLDAAMRALSSDPKNPENYYEAARVLQASGAHVEAVETFSMYISIPGVKPEYLADGYNGRAVSQRALKRPEAALADYTKAIEIAPKNADFYANRGYLLTADLGRHAEAIGDLTKAIELDPAGKVEAYFARAQAYYELRQYDRTIADLDKYISLMPRGVNDRYLADGYISRGIAYALSGRPERGVADLTKAIELAPDNARAYQARALLYGQLKKNDLAEADQRKAAELLGGGQAREFSGPVTGDVMKLVAEASRYYMAGDYKRAIPPYQKALDLEKQKRSLDRSVWIVLVDNLAMAYGITGDIKRSQAVLEYGISVEPTYPLFYYNMACGYGELGDEAAAIQQLGLAYKHKANMLPGEKFPDPMTDSSFAKFRSSDTFKKAVADMKKGR